jgi:membrane protein implicated in regulation of membrane protease activity
VEDWIVWLVVAVVFSVGEILTMSFWLAPFAAGALVAALGAAVGLSFVAAGLLFLGSSALLSAFVRPIARRHLRSGPALRTGTAALVGQTAVVVDRIDNDANAGTVRLGGELWTARAYDDDRVLEPGSRVHVMEIRGATALVSE